VAQRLSIVVDVADALEYLHHNNHGTIIHCDMKPSNILLDDSMTAHVGDFGLSRFIVDPAVSSPDDSYSTSSIAINGTIGYVAPGNSYFHILVSIVFKLGITSPCTNIEIKLFLHVNYRMCNRWSCFDC
jgi:serine/threonine protein kinase